MVFIARHQNTLEKLGLATTGQVKAFRGKIIKDHKGRRDILRVTATGDAGRQRVLFLKRTWKPYRKDGLASLLRHGHVWSISRTEWENLKRLQAAGIPTAEPVAFGEECGPFWEKFSFILTEAATGDQTVQEFLRECRDRARRRRVFDALARFVRQMHNAGLATPDLFTRHIFITDSLDPPRFCLIDMARLDRNFALSRRRHARDLAALNITAPLRYVTARERVRFLKIYAGGLDRALFQLIRRRMNHLLPRGRFKDFHRPVGSGLD